MQIDYFIINIPTKSKMEQFIYHGKKLYVVYVVRYLKIIIKYLIK